MAGILQETGSLAQTDDRFVVRYSGEYPDFYLARILPLFAAFAILAELYPDDDYRRLIFSRFSSMPKAFSWFEYGFLLALMLAPVVDLVLTTLRVRSGAVALSVSAEGITGAVFHITRLIPWSEIADVAVEGKFIIVRRRPRTLVQKLFSGRGLGDIVVAKNHLDRDPGAIIAAARRAVPAIPGSAGLQ